MTSNLKKIQKVAELTDNLLQIVEELDYINHLSNVFINNNDVEAVLKIEITSKPLTLKQEEEIVNAIDTCSLSNGEVLVMVSDKFEKFDKNIDEFFSYELNNLSLGKVLDFIKRNLNKEHSLLSKELKLNGVRIK